MANALRLLASAAILALSVLALERYAVGPVVASHVVQVVESRTARIYESRDPLAFAPMVRDNIARTTAALHRDPASIDLLMDKAANLRLLGRTDEAIAVYQSALRIDRRPEIYFNIGAVQLAKGQREQATRSFLEAALFNPVTAQSIEDDAIRYAVRDRYWAINRRPR